MRRFHTALGLLFVCAGLMSLVVGCTTLRLAGMANSLSLVTATSPPPSPALLEAMRTSLSVEAWRFNRGWTPESEWDNRAQRFPSPSTLRWSFGKDPDARTEKTPYEDLRISKSANRKTNSKTTTVQPNKPEAPAKTDTTESSSTATQGDGTADQAGDENSVAWDGFWPLTVSDLVHRHERRATEAAAATVDDGMRCLHRLARVDSLAGWNAAILWGQHDPQSAVEIVDVLERLVINPPLYVAETGESESMKPDVTKANASMASKDSNAANDSKHKTAENTSLQRPMRRIAPATQAAAAEAWCLVLSASAAQAVDGLAPAGRALERVNLPNSVRGEVFRGVAAWVPPAHIPRLENALRQGEKKSRAPADIRQAAIEGCLIYAINRERANPTNSSTQVPAHAAATSKQTPSDWPSTIMSCRIDPDFQVRRTFIQWLGRARPDGVFELLKTQAESAELALRAAALESLGRLHTDAAHAEIKAQADKTRDSLRAAAVGALSSWGIEEVSHYAHDKSQIVRMAVARELGKRPTLDSAILLTAMVVDPSLDVQLVAVDSVKTWPNDVAFPLLLHAMRDSSAKTRMTAFAQVSQRKKVDIDYRFDGPPDQRQAAVNAVAAAVGSSLTYLDQMLRREPRAALQVNALRVAEIREHLTMVIENPPDSPAATSARDWLTGIGPKDLPVVEAFLKSPTKASPEAIYREVLPRISPVYAALADLESSDLTVRRRGARTLADRGQAVSLSRPVLARLQERLYRENDELVWRWALSAIGSDATEECAELANLGLHHQAAEVRVLACEYLGHHGQPAYAVSLLNLLDDRDRSVKLAAIRALGNCGNQVAVLGLKPDKSHNASPNLRSLLSSPDGAVQFAAAVSLCRLGTAEGMQELMRLSYHANPDTRGQAVKEMGLSGQTRFVSHLVTMGWTERNTHVRQAILDSLDRLVPEENRPRTLGETPAPDAKIKCWVQWLQQRGTEGGAATASAPAGRPTAAIKGPTPGGPVVSRPDEG